MAGGGGDNAASAVGVGAVQSNQGFISLGTSGVVFLASDRFSPKPKSAVHAFCHASPGRWHQMAVLLSAASALRWARELVGLPYLGGERTPHNDPAAQGVLFGLTHEHGVAEVGYAVIEGVGFGLLDGWAALGPTTQDVTALSLVGGGARSALWAGMLASTLGVATRVHDRGEAGAALGAARLAWLADGGIEAEVCRRPPVAREFNPAADEAEPLRQRGERYRALYPALRAQFTTAADAAATP